MTTEDSCVCNLFCTVTGEGVWVGNDGASTLDYHSTVESLGEGQKVSENSVTASLCGLVEPTAVCRH